MGQVTIDGIPVYEALVDDKDCGMQRISLVDDPAVQSDFLAFKAGRKPQMYAVQSEERHLVLGVVMRADFPIYRRDKRAGEYYIIYKADTIRKMAEKYLAENRQNLVNLMHEEGSEVEGVQMVQYFIKGSGINPEGFEHIADGSLFAEFHVTNEDVWAAVKDGTYRGFSLEGIFDLAPETDKDLVQEIVDALHGIFSRIIKPQKYNNMKMKGLLSRIAKALVAVEMGNVTTDKGILAWDGDSDLKEGDAVYIEDEEGNRSEPADGDYTTEDGKVIVVAGGKVSEIRDPQAEVAPEDNNEEEEPVKAGSINTDAGVLEWDGEEDLKEGDAVYVTDGEGNRSAAPDGDYVTEDGKTISVVDGKVASITDPAAEVAPEEQPEVEAAAQRMHRIAQLFSESYNEKFRKIYEAIRAAGYEDFYIVDAGDDFAVICAWGEDGEEYLRFSVTWDEEGNAQVSSPEVVEPAFVTPEERAAADAVAAENAALKEQLARTPAARSAHEEQGEMEVKMTGNPRLDRLSRLMAAGRK